VPTKSRTFLPLVVVGTLVLIVASMYWARQVLIPVALAMLLTFLLSPVDSALQRLGLGRVVSVALLAVTTFSLIGVIGWAISVQAKEIANNLPSYQGNIKKRIEDLRVGQGTTLDKIRLEFQEMIGDVTIDTPSAEQAGQPVLVTVQGGRFSSGMWQLSPVVRPMLESLFYILLVAMLVIFMLLERDEVRNRAIRMLGYGRLSLTTQALDEAGQRVSRYLFTQFIINACLGVAIGLGLFLLGVPYALLWVFSIIVLRFVPYIGIWIAAILPFGVSLATSSNWWQPLSVHRAVCWARTYRGDGHRADAVQSKRRHLQAGHADRDCVLDMAVGPGGTAVSDAVDGVPGRRREVCPATGIHSRARR
jgi:predicted PurR-regulated permease PerM